MDVRILYLDVDDEITTAANRVREADATRIAIVLPFGSRVATSRINFRLLSRDATLNSKRLSIVAADAATRALAASAGLPIFSTVAEYESANAADGGSRPSPETADVAPAAAVTSPPDRSPRGSAGRRPRGEVVAASSEVPITPTPSLDVAAAGAAAGAATGAGASTGLGALTADVGARPSPRGPSVVPAARVVADTPPEPFVGDAPRPARSRVTSAPADRVLPWNIARTPLVIGLAVLAFALVVGGVGAYVFLPTATAVISPRENVIGPIPLRIVADPNATAPDPEARVVPAVTKQLPVEATGTFQVTGKRVEESPATGAVRFRNLDFTSSNTIPRGSIVSTQGGIRFRTERAVTVPRAELVGLQVFPATASVKVRAVNAGTDGNVEPNTILVIPRGEDPRTLDVTNPDATSGGKRDEFPRVAQADVTAATKAVDAQLAAAFAEQLADPSLAADGTTVFPDTAALGDPSYSVDPATLVGQEIESFELGASATGTVLAVDESAVEQIAEENIAPQVQAGYSLIDGSSQVQPSPGEVDEGVITFPVTITARQILQIDPAAIEAEIRGKSLTDAKAILDRYGQSQLSVWPEWVGTVPTLDARVDVQTAEVAP